MKKLNLTILLTVLLSMVGIKVFAHDIEVQNADGVTIYYVWTNNNTELAVSWRGTYDTSYSNEYTGNVVIPKSVTYNGETYSVTSIGEGAFYDCWGLTSVAIPNSVTSIGTIAFYNCSSLTSVTIPNSVTSIGYQAFCYCSKLTSVTIPNSVTYIGNSAFSNGTGLTSVTIPNSVTSIGQSVFSGCSGLTSVTIPNSVKSIGNSAFENCSSLISVTIPNSVTSIGKCAFQYCTALKSLTIGDGVKSIDSYAFLGCKELTDVFCWAENVPNTKTNAFEESYIEYDTLHVPAASVAAYGEKVPWKDFKNIVSLTGEPRTEDTENSIAEVRALPVLIKTNGGLFTIEGIDDGEQVSVFGVDGVQQGQTVSQNGAATLNTSLPTGSVTIVKIGQNSVKVVVK